MKIAYKHILEHINSKPSINELSEKLFQLGHEHEIENDIFDMEFTPNRGDCLSVIGLLRDLSVFYKTDLKIEKYTDRIKTLELDFKNNAKNACPKISFLKIEISNQNIKPYKGKLKSYFDDLDCKKNNFFTDISNYLSYEMGQPTHCYDATKIKEKITLDYVDGNNIFETLLNSKINLVDRNLVFLNDNEIINLAGVIGGKNSSCSVNTTSALIECAYFEPEEIIGKSVIYDVHSDAAHKFERIVDSECHEEVLRRFVQIVSEYVEIKNVEIFSKVYNEHQTTKFHLDVNKINKIIGINLNQDECIKYLEKLNFKIDQGSIQIPSYRSDIKNHNDLAEEIARIIGYNNISSSEIKISNNLSKADKCKLEKFKGLLVDNGFNEVINNPFESKSNINAIQVDNPLDSNKNFLRTDLKKSLVENLLYNERRQKDSIKLFEISDVYSLEDSINTKTVIGIITSGRVAKNFKDFSKILNQDYLTNILNNYIGEDHLIIENIPRDELSSKLKRPVTFIEIDADNINENIFDYDVLSSTPIELAKYQIISDYPSSTRDLSFSIKDYSKLNDLDKLIFSYENALLKERYTFDYYKNEKANEIKIGYRLVFQSYKTTITDIEVDGIIEEIVSQAYEIESVNLPGF